MPALNASVESSDQVAKITKPVINRALQNGGIQVGVLVRQDVSHCDHLGPIIGSFRAQELRADSADGVDGDFQSMTDCIPYQEIVKAAALQVRIHHSEVFRRILDML